MADPIEILFGMLSWVDPRNHVLDGGYRSPWEGVILRGRECPDMSDDTLP